MATAELRRIDRRLPLSLKTARAVLATFAALSWLGADLIASRFPLPYSALVVAGGLVTGLLWAVAALLVHGFGALLVQVAIAAER